MQTSKFAWSERAWSIAQVFAIGFLGMWRIALGRPLAVGDILLGAVLVWMSLAGTRKRKGVDSVLWLFWVPAAVMLISYARDRWVDPVLVLVSAISAVGGILLRRIL